MGSSSYITNLDGEIVQHVEYVPFGEVFIEERNNSWNTPYLFNGKELDEETGLYYYGARYYNPRESIFLSVDPMFEKTMTPYQYAYQNPIKFIDPTGMEGENTNEPPIKGIAYFSDDTGQYFWNHNKDSYEHYATGQDGYSYYEGMYTVDESKGPVGDYTIHLEGGKPGELASKFLINETTYKEKSTESIESQFDLDFILTNVVSSTITVREKGASDTTKLIRTKKIENKDLKWYDHIVGRKNIVHKTYEVVKPYGSSNPTTINKSENNSGDKLKSTLAEKLGEGILKGIQKIIKK